MPQNYSKKVILRNQTINAGTERRWIMSGGTPLNIAPWDRLHFHIAGKEMSGVVATILQATKFGRSTIDLVSTNVWFEDTDSARTFEYKFSASQNSVVLSVPVVAPLLYDVTLRNTSTRTKTAVNVALLMKRFSSPSLM